MNSTSIRWNFQPAESDWESCFREFMKLLRNNLCNLKWTLGTTSGLKPRPQTSLLKWPKNLYLTSPFKDSTLWIQFLRLKTMYSRADLWDSLPIALNLLTLINSSLSLLTAWIKWKNLEIYSFRLKIAADSRKPTKAVPSNWDGTSSTRIMKLKAQASGTFKRMFSEDLKPFCNKAKFTAKLSTRKEPDWF